MDTLQDAYKDSEEDAEESSNPDPNQENQTPNPQINPLQNDNQNTKINPDKETHTSVLPNPSSSITTVTDSLAEETPIVPSAEPDPENKPELEVEPGPVAVESAKNENPTTTTEREPVENQAISEAGDEVTVKVEPLGSEDASTDSVSDDEQNPEIPENSDRKLSNEEDQEDQPSPKKQRSADPSSESQQAKIPASNGSKKSSKKKSKGNNVWTKSTSRKGKKKAKNNSHTTPKTEDTVFITPMPRFPDKNDDSRDAQICLSKVYKAEKVELSDDRLSAGSCKGYRMVRATRGVTEGTWYFEIKVVHLGESGHTRLGWSTEKGDLQAPVGYDANSFGYRDMDGSKIHKALRQKYAEEGYKEGDVIGFYINLPDGNSYAPKPPHLVWYKGQKYVCASDPKEDPPKVIPGSEMSFFKNGVCQGKAFTDLFGGRYYPAASMYTLPNQPNCVVKFNFGPDFECFPKDFGDRPLPRPMIEVPYHGLDNRIEIGEE